MHTATRTSPPSRARSIPRRQERARQRAEPHRPHHLAAGRAGNRREVRRLHAGGQPGRHAGRSGLVNQLAGEGILNFIEGGNEEDDAYAVAQGNTLATPRVPAAGLRPGQVARPAGDQHELRLRLDRGQRLAGRLWRRRRPRGLRQLRQRPHLSESRPDAGRRHPADQRAHPARAAGRPTITSEIGWDNATFSRASVASTSSMPRSTASRMATPGRTITRCSTTGRDSSA